MDSTMVLKIIIGLIIFLYALRGMRKGFIRTLMSMAFLIMAAVLVYFANPTVSSFLKEKTPVYDVLEDKCRDIFSMKNLSRLSGKKETASEEENDIRTEPTRIEQAKIIDSLALPDLLKTQLAENNNAELPLLKGVNRVLGLLVGTAQGICVVWILFLILTVMGGTDAGSRILILISQDKVLSVFYDTNIFLKLLMGMFGNLFIS